MQIHELNNFTGTLGSGAYLAVDDGNDTGKLSTQQLLAATEARIDNIIAGPAPSAEEIVDARLGDDGVTYPSLGDAIRDQVGDLKSDKSDWRVVGFNQWDEVWEVGGILDNGQDNPYVTDSIRSANYVPVDENEIYYFKSPVDLWGYCYDASKTFIGMLNSDSRFSNVGMYMLPNTKYIRFYFRQYGTVYNNDVCVNIWQPDTSIVPHNGNYVKYNEPDILYNRVLQDESDELSYRSQITKYQAVQKRISTFPNVEKLTGYSASADSTSIGMTALATMDTYTLYFKDATIYFPEEVITHYSQMGYLAICKLENAIKVSSTSISGTNGARYRNLESNLPSSTNPLVLSGDCAIAITVDTGSDVAIVSNGIIRTLTNGILLDQTQIDQINVTESKGKVAFDGTTFTFDMGNHKLYIPHEVNNTIRQNTWRLKRGSIVHNDVESDMWNGSDADGVVRLKDENDFIGGYHGDEDTTAISVFIDGAQVSTSTSFSNREFTTFAMFVTSNVYHCVDSVDSDKIAFVRNKLIFIDKSGVSISNHWVASRTVNVTVAYMGMLSVAKSLVTNYSMNSDNAIVNNTTGVYGASYCDKVKMFLNTGNVIEYSMSERSEQASWGNGQIYNGTGVSDRVKAYFAEILKEGGTYITLNQGDIIRATSTMVIK